MTRRLVSLINSHISLALLHAYLIAVLHMVADPFGDVLCRRIDVQYLINILMVESVLHHTLDVREVRHHAIAVQFLGFAIHHNNPVMTMQRLTFTLV